MRIPLLLLLAAAFGFGASPAPAPTPASAPPKADLAIEPLVDAAMAYARKAGGVLGGNYTFTVVQPPRLPQLGAGKVGFEATRLSKAEPVGRFFVVVNVLLDGQRAATTRVDLDGSWVGHLLRAKQGLARKTELSMDLLESAPFEGVPPDGALTELPAGQRLRGPVPEGKVLTRTDLEPIPLIQSGDRVRLTSTSSVLTVSVDTVARSRGGLGDHVRLETPGSKRIVTGIVTGPGEARLEN